MDVGTQILLLLLALGLMSFYTGRRKIRGLLDQWADFQDWRRAGMPGARQVAQDSSGATEAPYSVAFDPAPLAGAGAALARPPADLRPVLAQVQAKGGRYRIPLGWMGGGLVTAQLVGDVNHILISGTSDSGKDNAVMGMLLTLASQHPPEGVQFAIIDGKGLDWAGWANKAHCWHVALEPEEIAPAMAAITTERRRRGSILRAAGVAKWDEYQGGDLPLLVVFISELSLLEDATKASELTAWLNSELSAGRAFGLRFIIGTQNASNFGTRWRGQIGLYLAGFQPSRAADEPNTGLSSSDLVELGAIAPSQLPAPPAGAGVFTAVQGRQVTTVRASLLTSQHRAWVLSQLPNHTSPPPKNTPAGADAMLLKLLRSGEQLPIANECYGTAIAQQEGVKAPSGVAEISSSSSAVLSVSDTSAELVVAPEVVPADEQRRILAAAAESTSRRQVSLRLYEQTGGQRYTWVQLVCDAAGLLPAKGGAR